MARERIKKILNFEIPDRIGIFDDFADSAIQKWRGDGNLPGDVAPQEYFDFDIRLFGFSQDFRIDSKNEISLGRMKKPSTGENLKANYDNAARGEKFLVLSCMEPFEHMARIVGKEKLLTMMAEEANNLLAAA